MTITYTQKQAEKIAKKYNKYAKSKISADKVWCLWDDYSDQEMEDSGYASIEINRFESIDGCNHTIDIYQNEIDYIPIKIEKKYPFEEGDTYYTVENGLLVCSCWDETSEELHDAEPEQVYYCVSKDGLIEWVPQSGRNKPICSFPPELYVSFRTP